MQCHGYEFSLWDTRLIRQFKRQGLKVEPFKLGSKFTGRFANESQPTAISSHMAESKGASDNRKAQRTKESMQNS